jgi:hypothetical protein
MCKVGYDCPGRIKVYETDVVGVTDHNHASDFDRNEATKVTQLFLGYILVYIFTASTIKPL